MRRVTKPLFSIVSTVAFAAVLASTASAGTQHRGNAKPEAAKKTTTAKKVTKKKAYFFLDFRTPRHERYAPKDAHVTKHNPYLIVGR